MALQSRTEAPVGRRPLRVQMWQCKMYSINVLHFDKMQSLGLHSLCWLNLVESVSSNVLFWIRALCDVTKCSDASQLPGAH